MSPTLGCFVVRQQQAMQVEPGCMRTCIAWGALPTKVLVLSLRATATRGCSIRLAVITATDIPAKSAPSQTSFHSIKACRSSA